MAGGVGIVLWDIIRSFQYGGPVLCCAVPTVTAVDQVSARVRRIFI